MQTDTISTPRDNLLGVCHAIGEAFGFNPLLLRIAFGIAILIDFELAILAYAGLGCAVLAAILIARVGRRDGLSAAA